MAFPEYLALNQFSKREKVLVLRLISRAIVLLRFLYSTPSTASALKVASDHPFPSLPLRPCVHTFFGGHSVITQTQTLSYGVYHVYSTAIPRVWTFG